MGNLETPAQLSSWSHISLSSSDVFIICIVFFNDVCVCFLTASFIRSKGRSLLTLTPSVPPHSESAMEAAYRLKHRVTRTESNSDAESTELSTCSSVTLNILRIIYCLKSTYRLIVYILKYRFFIFWSFSGVKRNFHILPEH